MREARAFAAAAMAMCLAAGTAVSQTIKLGSLAPAGSPWEEGLRRLASEWSRLTGGKVNLRIYPGGIVGDEDDMLRKVRIGQLNALALSGPGLSSIVPAVLTLQMPQLVSNDGELDYLMEKMTPTFARQFEEKGFKLLAWTRAGWAYIFARNPVNTPDDLKRQKLWVWQGSPDEARAWRELGFQPVTLGTADIMAQLQSGGIDAFITSPLVVASNQYFAIANDMTDLKWAPFVGGLIVSLKVWESIPADLRPRLEQAAADVTNGYKREFLGADAEAIGVMKRHGLVIHEVTAEAQEAWRQFLRKGVGVFLGTQADHQVYETAVRYLEELHRSSAGR